MSETERTMRFLLKLKELLENFPESENPKVEVAHDNLAEALDNLITAIQCLTEEAEIEAEEEFDRAFDTFTWLC